MQNIFLDTDVIVDFSNGKSPVLEELINIQERKEAELYINPIVVTEFLNSEKLDNVKKLERAKEILASFSFLPLRMKVSYKNAELLRTKQIEYLPDGYIASTCLTNDFLLATRNKKHFKNVKGLKFYEF